MKKLICICLILTVMMFAACQIRPTDDLIGETPSMGAEGTPGVTPSADADHTPGDITDSGSTPSGATVTPSGENPSDGNVPTDTGTVEPSGATAGSSTGTNQTVTPGTQRPQTAGNNTTTSQRPSTSAPTRTPTSTPTPTPTPTPPKETKTFSIAISAVGSARVSTTKLNFKGYYKNSNDTNTVVIAEDATASFKVTANSSAWTYSSEYSTYPTSLMKVTSSGTNEMTVNVTLKAGTTVYQDDFETARFVYVPKNTVNNGVPTMLINVDGYQDYLRLTTSTDRSEKDIWAQASYAIVEGNSKVYSTKKSQGTLKLKLRGFSSFDAPKKSYTVKLDNGKKLLGMNSNRDWVLVANYYDRSLLRNYFAYKVGRAMNTSWTSDCNSVEVYLIYNTASVYLGNYLLVEKIEAAEEKINITEMTEKDKNINTINKNTPITTALAGSFLVELETFDRAGSGDMLINTGRYQMNVKSPDKDLFAPASYWPNTHNATKNTNLANYIYSFFVVVDDAIHTDNYATFSKYIDIDSFVDYYILNELAKNVDGNFRLSTYFYKDKGGKLKITIWDFDIAFGNCDYNSDSNGNHCGVTTGYYIRTETSWYRHLFNSSEFRAKVQARWKELRKGTLSDSNMASLVNKQASVIRTSANANFQQWKILGIDIWPGPWEVDRLTTFDQQVNYLVTWLQERAAWLDKNI